MNKKFIIALFAAATITIWALAIVGCNINGTNPTYYSVSNIEELKSMNRAKSYKLECDIDFEGKEWTPVEVINFDGNGHTIKNCTILDYAEGTHILTGFFSSTKKVKNVTFDNIEVNVTSSDNSDKNTFCGIVSGAGEIFDNVIIKNSTAKFIVNNTEFVYGGGISGSATSVLNCKIEHTSVDLYSLSSFTYIGGITGILGYGYGFGAPPEMNNCTADNLTFTANTANAMGGLIGYIMEGNQPTHYLKSSVFKESKLKLTSSKIVSSCLGGIIGQCDDNNTEITNCASIDNEITFQRKYYGYQVGGIAGKNSGKISECLSSCNTITCICESSPNAQNIIARIGGVSGTAESTIAKCVSQNNHINGVALTSSSNNFTAGLVGQSVASIVNCAINNNIITGGNKDLFSAKNDKIFNCFIYDEQLNADFNVNKLPLIGEWKDVISTLSLDPELWTLNSNNILNLQIAQREEKSV